MTKRPRSSKITDQSNKLIEAELLKQARNDKVIIFKKRRRQNSRRWER